MPEVELYTNDGLIQLQQVKARWVWANEQYIFWHSAGQA